MLTASLFAYLTLLIRMRHIAVQSALPDKRHVKDSILVIFRLQVLLLLSVLCVSVVRDVGAPGGNHLLIVTDLCVISNVVLTAVSLCFSLHLFAGQLRVADQIMKSSSGRRQLEAQCIVSSVRRQFLAHAVALVSDIVAIALQVVVRLRW